MHCGAGDLKLCGMSYSSDDGTRVIDTYRSPSRLTDAVIDTVPDML